jgi:Protein of unknown function (DUF2637)
MQPLAQLTRRATRTARRLLAPKDTAATWKSLQDGGMRKVFGGLVVVIIVGALFVDALAFWVSFSSIRVTAIRSGAFTPSNAWALPLLVDTLILVATCAELWLISKQKLSVFEVLGPKALLGAAAITSFVLNMVHVGASNQFGRNVAMIAPLVLVLAIETLTLIARRAIRARVHRLASAASSATRTPRIAPQGATTIAPEIAARTALSQVNGSALPPVASGIAPEIAQRTATGIATSPAERIALVRAMVAADPEVSIPEIVGATGVKQRRAYQLRAEARNGHGGS